MSHRFVSRILLVLLAVLLSISRPVCAQQVLVATDGTDLLGILDFATFSTTGTATYSNIGTVGTTLVCMGYDSGFLYGLDSAGKLYTVNESNGSLSAPLKDLKDSIQSAAWDGKDTFYILDKNGTLQSLDLITLNTKSQGVMPTVAAPTPDGFMAIKNGAIYIGGVDTNRSNNDAIYKITPNPGGTLGLSHINSGGNPSANTGFQALTAGVDVNSTLYGFGQHPNDTNANASHSIFSADTTTGAGTLQSYYLLDGTNDNVTAAVVFQSLSVPEASSLVMLSLMLGAGGSSLLLRRKRTSTA